MVTYIKINGFKSFHNFEMEFTPFTIIAGANASGKSNLFDALKLLSRLVETDNLKKAFREQRGEFIELFTQYSDKQFATEMEFAVEMLVNSNVKDAWGNEAELKHTRLRYELKIKRIENIYGIDDLVLVSEQLKPIKQADDSWIKMIDTKIVDEFRPRPKDMKKKDPLYEGKTTPYIETKQDSGIQTVYVPQDGTQGKERKFPLKNSTRTVLSSFDSVDFRHVLAAKEEMRSWKFLQLNPDDLRLPTSKDGDDVMTQSGKNMAAVLHRIKQADANNLLEIARKIMLFAPNFVSIDVIDDKENRQFVIKLKDKDDKEYSSRVLSEGTLRILALCIVEYDEKHTGLLCFEEPENGIHPYRISYMLSLLKDLSSSFESDMPLRQVIINTHSPVLVGCIKEWESDKNTSLWFAQMKNKLTEVEGVRSALSITSVIPVNKGIKQANFLDSEEKLGLTLVGEYLNTTPSNS